MNRDDIGRHGLSGAEEQRKDATAIPQFARTATPLGSLLVMGVGYLLPRVCRSCNPVPGDNIIGYITRGRGVTVHRADCSSVLNEDEKDRLITGGWSESDQHGGAVTVRVEAWDREGLVRDVTAILSDEKMNISALS